MCYFMVTLLIIFFFVWILCQRFKLDPLLPITSVHSSQVESALGNVHKQAIAKLANEGRLELLIIILPDLKGSYG